MKSILIISLILFSGFSNIVKAQDRTSYWMHGMGGDGDMMDVLASKYGNSRRLFSAHFTYTTTDGIAQSATDMHTKMGNDNPNSIMIAQCMGGVNAVYVKHFWPNSFGGIITMGSPFLGTYVSQNIQNGVYARFVQDAAWSGTWGPRSELPFVIAGLTFPATSDPQLALIGGWCLKDQIENYLIEKTKAPPVPFGTPAVIQEFVPGTSILNQIQTFNENYPKIAIWGNENGNALVHLGGSKLQNMNAKENTGHYVGEGNLNDDALINYIDDMTSTCDYMSSVRNTQSIGAYATLQFGLGAKLASMSTAWHCTAVYWDNTFNTACAELIGATRSYYQTVWGWYLVCPETLIEQQKSLPLHPCQPEDMVLTWTYRSVKITVTEESDGLITKNSAMALPGVQGNCIIRADGVNHEELKNHAEMFRIFGNIFDGNQHYRDDRYPDFFKVLSR